MFFFLFKCFDLRIIVLSVYAFRICILILHPSWLPTSCIDESGESQCLFLFLEECPGSETNPAIIKHEFIREGQEDTYLVFEFFNETTHPKIQHYVAIRRRDKIIAVQTLTEFLETHKRKE
jgi:hypothetical protein